MKKSDKIENAYIAVLAVIIAIIVAILGLNVYSNFQNVESNITIEELAKHESNDIESASSSIGNNVVESENNLNENNIVQDETQTSAENVENSKQNDDIMNMENIEGTTETSNSSDIIDESNDSNASNESDDSNEANSSEVVQNENLEENIVHNTEKEDVAYTNNSEVKELTFIKPVDGEIIKEYAKDNLVYSETLAEWTTHLGIDIKADKTTVVKAAAEGTIKSIKNDPRYGLTITIEHENGFQTIYSNLLSSEFVVEGENVTQGQSIGTVGNTSTFEFLDESHLHFELLQNGEYLDPTIYIK